MTYERNRKDYEYLETIAELVDQVDLDSEREALMRNPSKAYAATLYKMAIRLWFGEHGELGRDDDVAVEIADRHDIYL